MLPKPQNRLEVLLNKIATNTMNDLPIPQSRLELLVSVLITGEIDNLPSPQSRSEAILHCILLDTECNISPQSRVELFLKSIITLDIEGLPTPMSRLEWYLDYIVRNGCLEKYEYYPFQIRDYLNVKNTPKAKMKFKGMKGNTLVNMANEFKYLLSTAGVNQGKYTFENSLNYCKYEVHEPLAEWHWLNLGIIDVNKLKPNTEYTAFLDIKTTNKCQFGFSSGNYQQQLTNIGYIENGKILLRTKADLSFATELIHFYLTTSYSVGSIEIKGLVVYEGNHMDKDYNYHKGMKSFGESENKIEVLSVGNNLAIQDLNSSNGGNDVVYSKVHIQKNTSYSIYTPIDIRGGYICLNNKSTYRDPLLVISDWGENVTKFTIPSNFPSGEYYIVFWKANIGKLLNDSNKSIQIEFGSTSTEYQPYQSSKSIPMYRSTNGELVTVPVLRGKWEGDRFLWGDEIMLHDDGKLYYHKRCMKFALGGNEDWRISDDTSEKTTRFVLNNKFPNVVKDQGGGICSMYEYSLSTYPSDKQGIMVTNPSGHIYIRDLKMTLEQFKSKIGLNNLYLVVELAEEEVYPCELTDQLYSFDGETNIFINGGVVVGETTIEIGTKLGPIVAEIKQETLRNTKAVEGLLSHGVQEMAYQLYPEDFDTIGDTEKR